MGGVCLFGPKRLATLSAKSLGALPIALYSSRDDALRKRNKIYRHCFTTFLDMEVLSKPLSLFQRAFLLGLRPLGVNVSTWPELVLSSSKGPGWLSTHSHTDKENRSWMCTRPCSQQPHPDLDLKFDNWRDSWKLLGAAGLSRFYSLSQSCSQLVNVCGLFLPLRCALETRPKPSRSGRSNQSQSSNRLQRWMNKLFIFKASVLHVVHVTNGDKMVMQFGHFSTSLSPSTHSKWQLWQGRKKRFPYEWQMTFKANWGFADRDEGC